MPLICTVVRCELLVKLLSWTCWYWNASQCPAIQRHWTYFTVQSYHAHSSHITEAVIIIHNFHFVESVGRNVSATFASATILKSHETWKGNRWELEAVNELDSAVERKKCSASNRCSPLQPTLYFHNRKAKPAEIGKETALYRQRSVATDKIMCQVHPTETKRVETAPCPSREVSWAARLQHIEPGIYLHLFFQFFPFLHSSPFT